MIYKHEYLFWCVIDCVCVVVPIATKKEQTLMSIYSLETSLSSIHGPLKMLFGICTYIYRSEVNIAFDCALCLCNCGLYRRGRLYKCMAIKTPAPLLQTFGGRVEYRYSNWRWRCSKHYC